MKYTYFYEVFVYIDSMISSIFMAKSYPTSFGFGPIMTLSIYSHVLQLKKGEEKFVKITKKFNYTVYKSIS